MIEKIGEGDYVKIIKKGTTDSNILYNSIIRIKQIKKDLSNPYISKSYCGLVSGGIWLHECELVINSISKEDLVKIDNLISSFNNILK